VLGRPPFPIARTAPPMCDRNDENSRVLDSVDNTKGESPKQIATRARIARGPRFGPFQDRCLRLVEFGAEPGRCRWTPFGVPPRRRFGLDYCLIEVLKLPNHDPLPRECVAGPRPRARSSRVPIRPRLCGLESRPPMPLRRPDRLQCRDSQAARQPMRRALPRGAGGPRPATASNP